MQNQALLSSISERIKPLRRFDKMVYVWRYAYGLALLGTL